MRLMPNSRAAKRITHARFYDENPHPKFESSEAEQQAYHKKVVQVTSQWLKQWPDDDYILSTRLRSLLSLEESTTADVEAAYNAFDKVYENVRQGSHFLHLKIAWRGSISSVSSAWKRFRRCSVKALKESSKSKSTVILLIFTRATKTSRRAATSSMYA